jgi:hypothetical protein
MIGGIRAAVRAGAVPAPDIFISAIWLDGDVAA